MAAGACSWVVTSRVGILQGQMACTAWVVTSRTSSSTKSNSSSSSHSKGKQADGQGHLELMQVNRHTPCMAFILL